MFSKLVLITFALIDHAQFTTTQLPKKKARTTAYSQETNDTRSNVLMLRAQRGLA